MSFASCFVFMMHNLAQVLNEARHAQNSQSTMQLTNNILIGSPCLAADDLVTNEDWSSSRNSWRSNSATLNQCLYVVRRTRHEWKLEFSTKSLVVVRFLMKKAFSVNFLESWCKSTRNLLTPQPVFTTHVFCLRFLFRVIMHGSDHCF